MASRNVTFEVTAKDIPALERRIEKSLDEVLGYKVAAFIRKDTELAEIVAYRPFPQSNIDAAEEFNMIFCREALDVASLQKIMALASDTDEFHVHGREVYWLRRKKQGKSTLSTPALTKALDQPFTIRSAKTVQRMALKYAALRPAPST